MNCAETGGRSASVNCGSPWSQTFNYDIFGNLSKGGTQSFQPTYSYLTNHMTQIGSSTPTYDANGNVTNDFLHTYSWDAAGRPVTIDGVGVTYDASGRMVEQNKSGATYSQIVYTPSGAKLALMNGTSLVKAFVPLTGGSMAVYNSSGLAYYRHSDWIGTSRFASTPTRAMYSDGAYAPFGEAYAQSGTADLSFTGMNQDTVVNLYDFPAREYGTQGRWPSPDPAGISSVKLRDPQTWNRYAYVRNNPLHVTDPTGMKCDPEVGCDDSAGDGGVGGDGGDGSGDGGDGGGGGGGGCLDVCGGGGDDGGGSGGTPDPGPGNGGDNGSSCGFIGCGDGPSDPGSGNQNPGCGALSCGDPGSNSGTTNGDPSDPGNPNNVGAPPCNGANDPRCMNLPFPNQVPDLSGLSMLPSATAIPVGFPDGRVCIGGVSCQIFLMESGLINWSQCVDSNIGGDMAWSAGFGAAWGAWGGYEGAASGALGGAIGAGLRTVYVCGKSSF